MAAAAAVAAVAANGNCKFGGLKSASSSPLDDGHVAALASLESVLFASNNNNNNEMMASAMSGGNGGGGGGGVGGCLLNGHDLNGTSELFNAAAKLINGHITIAGGGAAAVPPLNGGSKNGCQDPNVSTTQVTIPKDVSREREEEVVKV